MGSFRSGEGPGRGSEFVVRLPSNALLPAPPASDARATPSPPESRRKRVLVVDDNKDAAEKLTFALSELGYEVAFALNGESALTRLRDFRPEVAVLYLGLPVIDGFELARRIHEEFADQSPASSHSPATASRTTLPGAAPPASPCIS